MRLTHTTPFTGICRLQPEPGLDRTMETGSRTGGQKREAGEGPHRGAGLVPGKLLLVFTLQNQLALFLRNTHEKKGRFDHYFMNLSLCHSDIILETGIIHSDSNFSSRK